MISDVLNVGGGFQLVLKPVRLAPIVGDVLRELRMLFAGRSLNVLVEVRVGNLGSFITEDLRGKLFDLFFTSGKKGGTGLGLAIVKKVIEAHGGRVSCLSEKSAEFPDGKVEFVWTLKRTAKVIQFFHHPAVFLDVKEQSHMDMDKGRVSSSVQRPRVVFMDDSPLARWAWDSKLKSKVDIVCFSDPSQFLFALEKTEIVLQDIDTLITDYWFASTENLNGLELAREVRALGFSGRILLASNGEFSAAELSGLIDKVVAKQPVDWDLL